VFAELRLNSLDLLSHIAVWRFRPARSSCASSSSSTTAGTAFFISRRADDAVGRLCSLMTLTAIRELAASVPCDRGDWNNLDRRLSGADIYSGCFPLNE
jgi:hypothetical protein